MFKLYGCHLHQTATCAFRSASPSVVIVQIDIQHTGQRYRDTECILTAGGNLVLVTQNPFLFYIGTMLCMYKYAYVFAVFPTEIRFYCDILNITMYRERLRSRVFFLPHYVDLQILLI